VAGQDEGSGGAERAAWGCVQLPEFNQEGLG
jgi:hypothetical protein